MQDAPVRKPDCALAITLHLLTAAHLHHYFLGPYVVAYTILFFYLLVCDDHHFKDEMLFYRFRRDDDTAVLNPDLAVAYRGCDIYHR